MNKPDYHLLAHLFPAPPNRKPRRAKREYSFNGRTAMVDQCGSEWEGYFEDDHSVTYIADTKRELLTDMENHAR